MRAFLQYLLSLFIAQPPTPPTPAKILPLPVEPTEETVSYSPPRHIRRQAALRKSRRLMAKESRRINRLAA